MILKNLVSDELNWLTIYLRASMSSLFDLFVILDVKDHIFEFLKANYAGLFICMLVYYLFNLLFGDFSAEFRESLNHVLHGDLAGVLHIKDVEDSTEYLFITKPLGVDGSRQELRVVDFIVLLIVHLVDDGLDELGANNDLVVDFSNFITLRIGTMITD